MRKPSIPIPSIPSYTRVMMNRINLESIQALNRKKIVRWVVSFLFLGGLSFLGSGCITPDYANDSYYSRNHGPGGQNYRQHHSPYYGPRGQYGVPYHGGGSQFHVPGGSGGGHNPMHVPGGRYHNIGRPGKWRL
ncbi:hypothetical protein AB3N60_03385 [Leptospira sp. WS39.C2]